MSAAFPVSAGTSELSKSGLPQRFASRREANRWTENMVAMHAPDRFSDFVREAGLHQLRLPPPDPREVRAMTRRYDDQRQWSPQTLVPVHEINAVSRSSPTLAVRNCMNVCYAAWMTEAGYPASALPSSFGAMLSFEEVSGLFGLQRSERLGSAQMLVDTLFDRVADSATGAIGIAGKGRGHIFNMRKTENGAVIITDYGFPLSERGYPGLILYPDQREAAVELVRQRLSHDRMPALPFDGYGDAAEFEVLSFPAGTRVPVFDRQYVEDHLRLLASAHREEFEQLLQRFPESARHDPDRGYRSMRQLFGAPVAQGSEPGLSSMASGLIRHVAHKAAEAGETPENIRLFVENAREMLGGSHVQGVENGAEKGLATAETPQER